MLDRLKKFINNNFVLKNPPYTDEDILKLPEKLYPQALKKIYKYHTNRKLNLKNPKTLGENIQLLKLYDNTPIKTQLTDKILVRDWVKDKLGEEYLKPVLWVGEKFDDIPFNNLPDDFYLKTNHGCKWHMHIKNKEKLLKTPDLYNYVKNKFEKWMNSCFGLPNLELQYKNIVPKLFVEENVDKSNDFGNIDIEIFCFDGEPKILRKVKYKGASAIVTVFDENYNKIDKYVGYEALTNEFEVCDQLKKAKELSEQLAKDFKFVRVDWFLTGNKLYFNEMTFTPCGGFLPDM